MIAHRIERYGPWLAASATFVGIVLFVVVMAYTFHRQENVDKRLCEQTIENRQGIRATWGAARRLVIRGLEDADAIRRTNRFFEQVLRPIPPLECMDNRPIEREG